MSERTVYFAYGSNLWPGQMRERCPGSAPLGAAVLKDFRLAFRGDSRRWGRGGVATVVATPGSRVPGVLYELGAEDVTGLHRWESVPSVYRHVPVDVTDALGRTVRAYTYRKVDESVVNAPSIRYFHQIWRSYKHHGLDEAFLLAAVEEALANGNGRR